MKLLSFGEVLWDVYPNKKCLGGAPLNFAAHFSKLGGEAYILSAIGNDEFKTETLKKLEAWGVCKDYLCISTSILYVNIISSRRNRPRQYLGGSFFLFQ